MLIAFRALQGAGAAIFPLSFGIIRDEFPPEKVGVAIGTVSARCSGSAAASASCSAALIVEHLSWQFLFLIGAVPVLISTVLIAKFVPESPIKTPAKPDYKGAAALSVGFASAAAGAQRGHRVGLDLARRARAGRAQR